MRKYFLLVILISAIVGCRNNQQEKDSSPKNSSAKIFQIEVNHASGFEISYEGNVKKVKVKNSSEPGTFYAEYALVQRGSEYTSKGKEIKIEIPIESFVSVSTTHIPFITLLNIEDKLKGFSGCEYVQDEKIKNLISKNKIQEIGFDYDIDIEKVIDISPEAMLVYPYEKMNFTAPEKAGIKIIYNAEYLEKTPLGKAEWIKFVSLFFNKEKEADSIFGMIENEYLLAKKQIAKTQNRPIVFSGKAQMGKWFIPAGNSFAAKFLFDAGANYPWSETEGVNIIEVSFEEILDKAQEADWWVITGTCDGKYSLDQLLTEDARYIHFDAFKNKKVLFCNVNESDYFGKGVAEPQVILNDLIYYFYGKENYQPRYFFPLK